MTISLSRLLRREPRPMAPPDPAYGWSGCSGRTRVLLECPPEGSPWMIGSILERSDLDVVVCEGPAYHERCPMAVGGGCRAAESADVIVNMLGTGTPARAEVAPAVIGAGIDPARMLVSVYDPSDAPEGTTLVRPVAGARELVGQIREAAASS